MHWRLACAVAWAAALVACSEPPTVERDQALGAIAAARAAGADAYAPGELGTAEAALTKYDTAVSQRDYRAALGAAIEARESAYAAARRAADGKAAARGEADELVAAVESRIAAAERRLAGADGPRPTPAASARLRASIKTATTAVQEARSLVAKQDYRGASDVLTPVNDALERDLAPAPPPAGRRGR